MAYGDLFQDDLLVAFAFSRSETGAFRDSAGGAAEAAADAPRFDHDADGAARGLLIGAGVDLGGGDRIAIDPLILPEDMVAGEAAGSRVATVFHLFAPAVAADADWEITRQAWYTRDAPRTINALLAQTGHHLAIGVIAGFRENVGGFVRLRGEVWLLAGLLFAGSGAVTNNRSLPLIVAGAERFDV